MSAPPPNPPRFSPSDLADLAHELRHLWHALVSGMTHTGRLEGLQRQQFWVLGALSHGPRRMGELAECANTTQPSLTGIVDRLEERGLVERRRSPDDRRVVEVALTPEGTVEMRRAHDTMLATLETALEPLDQADRHEFLRMVRTLNSKTTKENPPACT